MEIEIDFQHNGTNYNTLATMLEDGFVMRDVDAFIVDDYPIWDLHSFNIDRKTECVLSGPVLRKAIDMINQEWLETELSLPWESYDQG